MFREIDGKLLLNLKQEDADETYTCTFFICNDPLCDCSHITCTFFTVDEEDSVANDLNKTEQYQVTLDVLNRKIVKDKIYQSNSNSRIFADKLASVMGNDQWMFLHSAYTDFKMNITRNAKLEDLLPDFPMEDEIKRDGTTVGYAEILPFGEMILFEYEDKKYVVDDCYCVKSKCKCHETFLHFKEFSNSDPNNNSDDNSGNDSWVESAKAPVISFDYKKNRWNIESNDGVSASEITHVVREMLNQYKGPFFKQRHETLKMFYKKFKEKNRQSKTPILATTPKVGRNAACPCGSGKKYKRCCGA